MAILNTIKLTFCAFYLFPTIFGLEISLNKYWSGSEETGPKRIVANQDMVVFRSQLNYSDDPKAKFVYFQIFKPSDREYDYQCLIDLRKQCWKGEYIDGCSCTIIKKHVAEINISIKASVSLNGASLRGTVIRSYDNKKIVSEERVFPEMSDTQTWLPICEILFVLSIGVLTVGLANSPTRFLKIKKIRSAIKKTVLDPLERMLIGRDNEFEMLTLAVLGEIYLAKTAEVRHISDTTNLQETIQEDVIIYTMSVEGIERRNSLSETEEQSSGYCSSVSQGDDGADDSLDEDSFQSPLTFPTCSIKKDKDVEESSKDDAGDVSKEVDITDDIIQIGDEDDREEDSYIKNDEASLLHGTHETQLSEGGEADLHKHFDSCKKNPGHTKFVPVNDFNISHLPEGHHDNDLVEYIKATADLAVRVDVKMTSRKRPEFWPNTTVPYAFHNMRGSDVMRVGTGIVRFVNMWREKDIKKYNMGTCRCHKCQHSDTPSKYWGKVAVSTATQVVFDDLEARHTSCRLFFDRQDSPLVTLDGWMVVSANIEEDGCDLECMTCDVDLLDKLEKMMRHWYDLWEKVNRKYKKSRDEVKLTFIVSHPHGCPKQISVGHLIHKYVNDNTSTKYTYTTCTCPGSSGAPVYSLEHNNTWYYDRHVHSGVNSEGINFSGTGRLF